MYFYRICPPNLAILQFSVIDLTELEDTAEIESFGSPKSSSLEREKQVMCPVCQQLFSEAYITIHAADCELHVDTDNTDTVLPTVASSSKLRQTTLTHKPLTTTANTQRKRIIESDTDPEEVTCL